MPRFVVTGFMLALWITPDSRAEDPKALAQGILEKGAVLFDSRSAKAMSETYTDDARVTLYSKENGSNEYTSQIRDSRPDIESMYMELFKDDSRRTTSRNTVEDAALLNGDLLLIRGTFQPDVNEPLRVAFVQVRVKRGDKWLIQNLQLFVTQ